MTQFPFAIKTFFGAIYQKSHVHKKDHIINGNVKVVTRNKLLETSFNIAFWQEI